MKTYSEQARDIRTKLTNKIARKRRNILAATSMCCCLVLILGLVLFVPYNHNYINVTKYAFNEYYPLIKTLNKIKNDSAVKYSNFDRWFGNKLVGMDGMNWAGSSGTQFDGTIYQDRFTDSVQIFESTGSSQSVPSGAYGSSSYEEITDNQVQGVTEADRIKRSDKYIYYLRNDTLFIYSIDGEHSQALNRYTLAPDDGFQITQYGNSLEMYLSDDCTTVTIIAACSKELKTYTYIVSLDVSEPMAIRLNSQMYITGGCLSSRLIDGNLYIFSRWYCDPSPDYSDNATFLPQYGTADQMECIPMDNIIIPENPTSTLYTVVSKLDQKTLAAEDTAALLSYASTVYVSDRNIFLTRVFSDKQNAWNHTLYQDRTEICQIGYTGDGLEYKGSFCVDGTVNNQYSMDEYDGILRVVTTTKSYTRNEQKYGSYTSITTDNSTTNASLFCIDLSDHRVQASVENFAPEGESVRSARFDGEYAYVCTSVVLMDPVFFFDLSDLDHITYKDTGTIDGYSMSLIDFADGFLMGIGYGESFNTLKIEIYREGDNSVEPHCKYEKNNVLFSSEYKSYYIDRENRMIGLGLTMYGTEAASVYTLLHFDGYALTELIQVPMEGNNAAKRAVYIDGYLYIFGDTFTVEKVG